MNKKLLDYFNGDELAANVWKSKYAAEGEELPSDMHRRMAKEFARVDLPYQYNKGSAFYKKKHHLLSEYGQERKDLTEERIFNLFKDFKYIIPQGSVMSNLGSDEITSLSNCLVVASPEDSYGGIFKTDQELVQLMKRRCGVGVDISTLRPAGVATTNAAKSSTGAVSFAHRFSNSTREVAQNGRRGALMLSMDVRHPDIMEFIKIKRDLSQVTGANISIKLDGEFMKAVENDEDYILRFPCDANFDKEEKEAQKIHDYNKLITYYDGRCSKRVNAKEYWDEIIESAHGVAEPGLMFWDNMIDYSPDGVYPQFRQVTTNPCSEIAMQPHDACRLIAVNLFSFVDNPFTKEAVFNYKKFYEINYEAMRLSDDLIDLELEHIDRIIEKIKKDPEPGVVKMTELALWKNVKETAMASRRTGLGFTALGDTLAALGINYGSEEALDIVEGIMEMKMESELDCTTDLAILRGTFEGWDVNLEYPESEDGNKLYGNDFYYKMQVMFPEQIERMKKFGRRNLSFSTVAPTGTVSLLAQTTSGIEPLYQPFYIRRRKLDNNVEKFDFQDQNGDKWEEFPVLHPKFKEWIKIEYKTFTDEDIMLLDKKALEDFFLMSPWYGSTAEDINWEKRVDMQATIQKYVTHSISSTVNLPSDVSLETVSNIYKESWARGIKGITVYRDGSRSGVLVTNSEKELVTFNENHAPKRPKSLACKIVRFNNNYEKWVAFVGLLDNKPYEIFTGKLENVELPNGVEVGEIVKVKSEDGTKRYDFVYEDGVVENISGVSSSDFWNYGKLISGMLRHGMPLMYAVDTINNLTWDSEHINTWKAGVVRALRKFIKDGKAVGFTCQDCGSDQVVFEEGCLSCKSCGSSACG